MSQSNTLRQTVLERRTNRRSDVIVTPSRTDSTVTGWIHRTIAAGWVGVGALMAAVAAYMAVLYLEPGAAADLLSAWAGTAGLLYLGVAVISPRATLAITNVVAGIAILGLAAWNAGASTDVLAAVFILHAILGVIDGIPAGGRPSAVSRSAGAAWAVFHTVIGAALLAVGL